MFASKAQRLRSWAPAHWLDAEAETALESDMQPEGCQAKTALLERAVSHCEWRISEDSEWARSARAEHVRSTKKNQFYRIVPPKKGSEVEEMMLMILTLDHTGSCSSARQLLS